MCKNKLTNFGAHNSFCWWYLVATFILDDYTRNRDSLPFLSLDDSWCCWLFLKGFYLAPLLLVLASFLVFIFFRVPFDIDKRKVKTNCNYL